MKHKPYQGKEDDFQIAVAKYLDAYMPRLLWCHVPNESRVPVQYRVKQKRKGLKKGVPDILIFNYQLAIELKVNNREPGLPQINWMARLGQCGWKCYVAHSLDYVIEIIDKHCK